MADATISGASAPDPAWNVTAAPLDPGETVVTMIDRCAHENPARPALETRSDGTTSYVQLVERSSALASTLAHLGVGAGCSVAVLGSRSASTVTSLLGTIRSGAAYVPLDPVWPVRRLIDMLDAQHVEVLVTDQATLSLAQLVGWSSTSVRHVVCPDIEASPAWRSRFRGERIANFFDEMIADDDPVRAAGFALRSTETSDGAADLDLYRQHVVDLVTASSARPDPRIIEIGSGSGVLAAALSPHAARYTATDPSRVSTERCNALGPGVEALQCFAHELDGRIQGEYDVCVIASAAQFFPGLDYLFEVLATVGSRLAPRGVVVLADVLEPDDAGPGLMGVPVEVMRRLPEIVAGVSEVEVVRRPGGSDVGTFSTRYDVVIRYVPERGPELGRDRPWVLTGADVGRLGGGRCATSPPDAGAPCYTIFTSGSTGQPKGVTVSHDSVVNLVSWLNPRFDVGPTDKILFTTPFFFDLSVYDIFGVLAAGGSVRIASDAEVVEPDLLLDVVRDEGVTIWDSTPGALGMLLAMGQSRKPDDAGRLRLVLLSGDWIPLDTPGRVRETFGDSCEVVALGGATECTVWSNFQVVDSVDPSWQSIPYGRPIQNARYYVLDERLRACPPDVEGDLYIAGRCVALGYAGKPGTTAGRFIADPWPLASGERMYRTGDRASWLASGVMQFHGRLDDQVKVRGYRIELGEVWRAMIGCDQVTSAAVFTVTTKTGPSLVGAYVPAHPGAAPRQVKAELARSLPRYMVPDRLVPVEAIPLTPAGKPDKKRLLRIVTPKSPSRETSHPTEKQEKRQ